MKNELTPHIEYHNNGNVFIKGQRNSKGEREGLWELFYSNGNIHWRTSFKDDKIDGTEKFYDEQGNIVETRLWKNGKLIETTKH